MIFAAALLLASSPRWDLASAVVYEANLRAEGPRGGFSALTGRLDSIKRLGVNVLWLMPVQPVGKIRSAGGLGSPYAVADYSQLNPEFGTPNDFRRLIQEAHRRRIAVIIDWVANHTAWDHPWVKEHPGWYTHDGKGQITIPAGTNWNDVADLNYDNPGLRRAMISQMTGWLDRYGIDGFRCDTADYVPYGFWKEAISSLRAHQSRPLFMLAEGFRSDHYGAGFDLTYGWNFYHRLRDIFAGAPATELAKSAAIESRDIPPGARRLRFITNHDEAAWQGTPLEFFKSPEGVRTAFAVTAFYGGTPLIYSGQEVAWPKRVPIFERSTIDWKSDPSTKTWLASLFNLRRKRPSLERGEVADRSTKDAIVFLRSYRGEQTLVLANVRNRPMTIDLPRSLARSWKDAWTNAPFSLNAALSLPPYGLRVLSLKTP